LKSTPLIKRFSAKNEAGHCRRHHESHCPNWNHAQLSKYLRAPSSLHILLWYEAKYRDQVSHVQGEKAIKLKQASWWTPRGEWKGVNFRRARPWLRSRPQVEGVDKLVHAESLNCSVTPPQRHRAQCTSRWLPTAQCYSSVQDIVTGEGNEWLKAMVLFSRDSCIDGHGSA